MSRKKVIRFVRKLWKEWWKTVVFIVFVVIPLKSSIADWNWVPTGSMNPTILEGDLVYVNKLAYDLRFPLTFHRLVKWSQPERGDIVICFSPEDGTRLVKRIIALPGDTIEMKSNVLFINGRPINYTRIDAKSAVLPEFELKRQAVFAMEDLEGCEHTVMSVPSVPAIRDFGPVVALKDNYFVMGDNRDVSRDSRYFGFVERKSIIGQAKAVIVSFDTADKYRLRPERIFTSLK